MSLARRAAALALWAAVIYCVAPAYAQQPESWTPAQCERFGQWAGVIADFRDSGASVKRHLETFHRRAGEMPLPVKRVFERELLRVYAEGFPGHKAELAAYTRCMSNEINAKEG